MTVYINGVAVGADGEVGGLYGINVETLTGNKTLVPGTDKIYQYLDEGGSSRIITLNTASASAGDRFIIRHNGAHDDANNLQVKEGATVLDQIYAGGIKEFLFDGTHWISRGIGTGEDDTKKYIVGIGQLHDAHSYGTAVGRNALGYDRGVALGVAAEGQIYGAGIGNGALGYNQGAALGYKAYGYDYGVAIGWYASSGAKKYAIALGSYSKNLRVGETSVNINGGDTDQENNVVQGRWEKETANDTPVEMFCAGQANARFTIRAQSALAFRMMIVARDNVGNEVAMYTVSDGLIKRDGANNTVMVNCTVTVVHEDDATWDVAVAADDTNEALIITVTGDDTNPVQWAAVLDGVETHF